MNKSTLEQMKGKDSMVKRHVHMQDSDIAKLKQKLSDQEKHIKTLRDEIQVYILISYRFLTIFIAKNTIDYCFIKRQGQII